MQLYTAAEHRQQPRRYMAAVLRSSRYVGQCEASCFCLTIFSGVDSLTKATCHVKAESGADIMIKAHECVSEHGKAACAELGGVCETERDGYFATSSICLLIGAILLITFIQPTARKLQGESALGEVYRRMRLMRINTALPQSAWRVKLDRQ